MRKIIAAEFMTIDGVIQNEEADGDGFKYGGWFFPYADAGDGGRGARAAGQIDGSAAHAARPLTVGRRTGRRIRAFWPNVMTATKYVASNTRTFSDWQPNVFLSGDIAEKVREGTHHRVTENAEILKRFDRSRMIVK